MGRETDQTDQYIDLVRMLNELKLTAKQKECLNCLIQGIDNNREIAELLGVTPPRVAQLRNGIERAARASVWRHPI